MAKFLCVRIQGVRGSAALIGVDVNVNGQLPCKEPDFIGYNCCDAKNSYYRTCLCYTDGSIEHTHGLFINNSDKDNEGNEITHDLANLATRIDVEIYPKLERTDSRWASNEKAGRVRFDFSADEFTHPAHDGLYSPDVGYVLLPLEGFSPFLNGTVTENGEKVQESRGIDIKLWGRTPHPENSTAGADIYGFSIIGVENGYYHSGPMLSGSYEMVISDPQSNRCYKKIIDITRTGERIDLLLEIEAFGIGASPCS
ncbi:hypothetical protein [Paenibacillus amylolyticus]|uniref:hypothetical protein n=1 Tax=Paenibacillus amylolyticus TaxID=1451 RepID=UPI00339B2730